MISLYSILDQYDCSSEDRLRWEEEQGLEHLQYQKSQSCCGIDIISGSCKICTLTAAHRSPPCIISSTPKVIAAVARVVHPAVILPKDVNRCPTRSIMSKTLIGGSSVKEDATRCLGSSAMPKKRCRSRSSNGSNSRIISSQCCITKQQLSTHQQHLSSWYSNRRSSESPHPMQQLASPIKERLTRLRNVTCPKDLAVMKSYSRSAFLVKWLTH